MGETAVLALGPIGVIPDRQGNGMGSALVRAALAGAAERDEVAVILLGAPAYYGRFGFRAARSYGLANPFVGERDDGFRVDEEDFQIVILDDRVRLEGDVRWHPAFG
jgi:predicted N-acetyltransferase YhbS